MIVILFTGTKKDWAAFEAPLRNAIGAFTDFEITQSAERPERIDYVIYSPLGQINDFEPFINLRAVFSLWAGVEKIVTNESIKVPLTRMVEPGLEQGMAEYVTCHALQAHLNMHLFKQDGVWRNSNAPPLASARKIGILGSGKLALAAATMCCQVGFNVMSWSRSEKDLGEIEAFSGQKGFNDMLAQSDILVCLLPLTKDTKGIIDKRALMMLPQGACVLNPGRGPLINDKDLIDALNSGHIAHATLDVFDTEPLPPNHVFWSHPNVTVTPHVAAATRPETGAIAIAENLRRHLKGQPLLHVVNRDHGY